MPMISHDRLMPDCENTWVSLLSDEIVRTIVAVSQDALCIVRRETGQILFGNVASETLLGYSSPDWTSLSLTDVLPDAREFVPRSRIEFSQSRVRHRDGHVTRVQCCLIGSPHDAVMVAMFRALAPTEPVSDADLDPLTGLPNRRVFEQRLQDCIDGDQSNFAVLFVDLNGFKEINDRMGHHAGDVVLAAIAERLPGCLRPIDLVARYGGDEFVILLKEMEREEWARAAAERLLKTISEPILCEDTVVELSASLGVVLGSPELKDVAEAVRAADRAMYQAKELGPSGYAVWQT